MAEIEHNSVGIVQTKIIRVNEPEKPLELECGKKLAPIDVAYETYGKLDEAGDNAILICHALSGDAHAASVNNPDDNKPGWWDTMVGPGKGIDTDKYFVICSNFLGGCSGTTGPSSINPASGKSMVKVQKLLLDKLGIKGLLAVIGGSIGGMQVLQWSIAYPDFVKAAIPIATTTHLGAQSIAFDAVGRNAILEDSNFAGGQYTDGKGPDGGLAIARMIGHITYLSEQGMREKFGRELRNSHNYRYDFNSEFAVETYLDHQGQSFVGRFDANSYLYITKASDYFDIGKNYGSLTNAFSNTSCRFLIISFTIVDALVANNKDVSFCDIASPYGHDAFLLEPDTLGSFISGFLDATYRPEAKKTGSKTTIHESSPELTIEQATRIRIDYEEIESLIEPNSTVLDIGCGDGQLLANLSAEKNIKGMGIELDQDLVRACVEKGLPIIQQDIEQGLENYTDKSYDYVILSQTVQTIKKPEKVFTELLRVGRKVIVSFPNFAYWRCRAQLFFQQLFFQGKAPVTRQLPFDWCNSPNIHCLSIKDFDRLCRKLNVKVEERIPLNKIALSRVRFAPNFFAEQVIYVTSKE